MLGLGYMRKGETDYTRQMLTELKETIDFAEYLTPKTKPNEKTNPKTKSEPEFRIWREVTGKFSVEATLVEKTSTDVVLRKKDGKIVTVPLLKLSTADVNFVSRSPSQ